MARSRDISKVLSSNTTLATDAEVAATYLTQSNSIFAGKNKIINGDFGIWQRGTSFTNTANAGYTADRWQTNVGTGGTIVTSQQSFTPGTAPVAGYEAPFFLRLNRSTTGSGTSYFVQRIEDVRTFAGQTVTLSFWAKASSAYTFDSGDIYSYRNYGTGGSTAEGVGTFGAATLSTSWQRFSLTLNIPSVSGKTIGASSYLEIAFSFPTSKSTFTIDIWGVQVEAGSIATPFVPTGGGSQQAELSLCQRYYEKSYDLNINPGTITDSGQIFWTPGAIATGAITAVFPVEYKVSKRIPDCTITYYSPATGSSGVVRNRKNNGTSEVDKSTGLGFNSLGQNRWHTNFGSGVGATEYFNDDTSSVKFHWTSSAEL
jgi:hypothetical protein